MSLQSDMSYPRFEKIMPEILSCETFVYIDEVKSVLKEMVVFNDRVKKRSFPLSEFGLENTKIGSDVMKKLEESWDVYQGIPDHNISILPSDMQVKLDKLNAEVVPGRQQLERIIFSVLQMVPNTVFNIRRAANIESAPAKTGTDLLRIACDPTLIYAFNPCLSENARSTLG